MASPATTDDGAVVELAEEIDGEEIGSRNYRFSKIGASVSINSEFDPQCLPSQPLAVSERLRLLFVAYTWGFYVARTKDVINTAEEIKEKQNGPSIQELSLVDVPIGRVSILALSADDSLLAASVASHVHFFAVSALLHKDKTPSYSVPLDDSSCIKDVRWAKKVPKTYLILSDNGKLYHGSGQDPIVFVTECVDSVDWSVKGSFVAVAKKNTVSILSSELKEKIRFLLPFQSVVGDSDVNQSVKVDSIRWIRPDCIAVGCFHMNDDGEEENYVVQVITSRGRRLTDAASKPIVLSFSNVFMDFCNDAVPTRNGPHLFLSYLDLYGLAFIANRNLSRSVGLFCWSPDSGKNEPAMVEILNDAWNLYIDSQENGEENVIVGLSVEKVSQNVNARFTLGDEETEISPCCVIICLTIDGKISVFHFASAAGALVSPESCTFDEEADSSQVLVKHELPQISSTGGEESKDPTFSASGSYKISRFEAEKAGAKATITNDLSPSNNVNVKSQEQTTTGNMGQKPLVYSSMVNMDKAEKAIPVVLNKDSNSENQSLSEVICSTAFFSGKVVGDSSGQSITKDPPSGCNIEPLHKPPTSASLWSLTKSSAGDDASKISDGRFLSLPSVVDDSNKPALQSAGHVLHHHAELNEKVKSPETFTSFRQTASTGQGLRNSMSANPGSQVSLRESVALGKPFQSEFKKDLKSYSSPTPTELPYSMQNASKQFGNVEEMAKGLDILLEGIEGKGGFVDTTITSQTKSVMELEDGIWALSRRCRSFKGLMNEQLKELQLLLDKTVQVLVRKVYMEGVFKQATDSRYWELWNRQKLSSELELKQRRIIELDQELTNKLIELERHFNTLEFNKFGENGGMQRNQRVLQNEHSRQTVSLYSLHNTMQAQLAAAEQLSGYLSNQMAALSIKSSEKQDVKKKLFESIGLSYIGDSEKSPVRNTSSSTPLNKEHLITSNSIASKEHSRRKQASFAKSPETARRRRDSLDRSWASFEPPKTTVKRALKEDNDQGNANRSLLNIDKQYLSPQSQKKSEVAHSAHSSMFRASLNSYKSKGTAEIPEQHTEIPLPSLQQRTAGSLDNGVQLLSTKSSFALPSPSIAETRTSRYSEQAALELIDEKSKSSLPYSGKKDSIVHEQSGESVTLHSVSTESSDHFKLGFTKSTPGGQKKNTWTVSETPSFDSPTPVNPASAFNSGTNVLEKGLPAKSSEKPNQPHNSTASVPSQSLLGSSLISSDNVPSFASSVSKSSPSTSFPVTKQEVSHPQTSVPSTLNVASTSPLVVHESNFSSMSPSSGIIMSESLTSLSNPPVATLGSKTETKTKMAVNNTQPETALSTHSKLGSEIDSDGLSKNPSVPSVIKTELSSAIEALSPVALSSEGNIDSVKNNVSDPSDEEEMEEEPPEMNQITDLSLGRLGGFGLGSTPNSTSPKPNPFGVSTLNKNTTFASLPTMMPSSSGELFRPASFNLQPPQPTVPLQPTTVNFSGGFSSGNSGQVSVGSGFGQPANIGAGQQALGSVLGSFGQSRQLGAGLPGSSVAPASGFGGGFGGISPGGFGRGFATAAAASAGGFASLAAGGGGGFAAAGGGGFAAAAIAGGGFAAAAAAAPTIGSNPGGGFGAFGNQQGGSSGFSAFGGSSGVARPPSQLFTQMRK